MSGESTSERCEQGPPRLIEQFQPGSAKQRPAPQQRRNGTDIAKPTLDMEPNIGQLGALDFGATVRGKQDSRPLKAQEASLDDGHSLSGTIEEGVLASILQAAMATKDGKFHFDETEDISDEITIDENTPFLILEALRQIDESRGGQ